QWQALEDHRVELQEPRDTILKRWPELKSVPGAHYATLYRRECAPDETPQGEKLYYCTEGAIDTAWPPNTTIGQARQGATEAVRAWRADLKRQLAEAQAQRAAEERRVGLTAADQELDDTINRALDIRDEIKKTAAASLAGTVAKLFIAVQEERGDYRRFTIDDLTVVPFVANALR